MLQSDGKGKLGRMEEERRVGGIIKGVWNEGKGQRQGMKREREGRKVK